MRFATIVRIAKDPGALLGRTGRMAVRGVFRHGARTAITLAAVAFGTAGVIVSGGCIHDIFIQLGKSIIHSQSGHLKIAKQGFFGHGSRSTEKYLISDPALEKTRVASLRG